MPSPARHRITIRPHRPPAVHAVAGGAQDGDDLLDLRRISRIAQPLVARRTTNTEPGHGRRRPTSTSAIKQQLANDPSSGSQDERQDQAQWWGVTRGASSQTSAITPKPEPNP